MMDPIEFYNKIKSENKHTGIRINNNNNNLYKENPFENIDPFINPDINNHNSNEEMHSNNNLKNNLSYYENLNLNIDNYSKRDLYQLFGIKNNIITNDILKMSKKTVLKMHPDKSNLDSKYFLFFSKAYKRLYHIYEFQNKVSKKNNYDSEYSNKYEYYNLNNEFMLDNFFDKNPKFKPNNESNESNETNKYNEWFNNEFEQFRIEDPMENGYGEWLKSDEPKFEISSMDMNMNMNIQNVNDKMDLEIEKIKKTVQSISVYNGIKESTSSQASGSRFEGCSLMDQSNNFTSGSLFTNNSIGYSDLKQAYTETVIPITKEDYNKIHHFDNVDEYKKYRDTIDLETLNKEASFQKLYEDNVNKDEESSALAFHYAQQAEKIQQKHNTFWSTINQISN